MKRGALLTIALLTLAALFASVARAAEGPATSASQADRKAVIIQLQGEIDDYNRDALFRRFDEARQMGAKVIVLDVDTYGGLVTAGLEISRFIKRQNDLHVIAFVKDKAISAGAMIAMACDEIVMSGSSSLGDCAPIIFGQQGLETMGAAERAKAEAPVLLDFDESAKRNHRDPLLAAGMVDVTRVIYWVQNTAGERRFVDEQQYKDLIAGKDWVNVPGAKVPIKSNSSLLTVDGDEAIHYGLATGEAASAQALAQQRNYDVVGDLTPGAGEKFVEFISSALVRGILLVVFLQCLYIVLHAPGHGVAETVGLVALGLMLGVPLLAGYAQWWEILVIFVGLALVAFEILLPGHIFPGITGAILVVFGIIMTFVPKQPGGMPTITPNIHYTWLLMQKGVLVVAAGMGASLFLWFWLNRFLPRMPMLNRLIITATSGGTPPTSATAPAPSAATTIWPPIGGIGRAISELKPGGSAEFYDPMIADRRTTSVVSESGFVPPGAEIVVREVAGTRVVVKRKD